MPGAYPMSEFLKILKRTITNAQNTTRKTMTRTRQTKGSTSSKSSAFGSVFAPSATKMQETRNNMPATLEPRGGN